MCCFSVATPTGLIARLFAKKVHVSHTHIFARMVEAGVQALAYGMTLASAREVAMVLPLPVRPGSGEGAVRFVDLQQHPRMFDDLSALFEIEQTLGLPKGGPWRFQGRQTLTVHQVGSFVASYVPTRADFARLDPRFRMPEVLFDAVPHYGDYGFAVFQLQSGTHTIHPMAFTFPTREPGKLFFPTVHVHDGRFHKTAHFDHALYYQHARGSSDDEVAMVPPSQAYEGLVALDQRVSRRKLHGKLANADTWVA